MMCSIPSNESDLQCSICWSDYEACGPREPRIAVSCGHTFCSSCLSKVACCPTCRASFGPLPFNFPKNHILVSIIDGQKVNLKRNELKLDESKRYSMNELNALKKMIEERIKFEFERDKKAKLFELKRKKEASISNIGRITSKINVLKSQIVDHEALLVQCKTRVEQLDERITSLSSSQYKSPESLIDLKEPSISSSANLLNLSIRGTGSQAAPSPSQPSNSQVLHNNLSRRNPMERGIRVSSVSGSEVWRNIIEEVPIEGGRFVCPFCNCSCKSTKKLLRHCELTRCFQ